VSSKPQYKHPNRAKQIVFPDARSKYSVGLKFCVYNGNYPNVIREALALRVDSDNKPLWTEVDPKTDCIPNMDLVWKPVNFVRTNAHDLMSKRVFM